MNFVNQLFLSIAPTTVYSCVNYSRVCMYILLLEPHVVGTGTGMRLGEYNRYRYEEY